MRLAKQIVETLEQFFIFGYAVSKRRVPPTAAVPSTRVVLKTLMYVATPMGITLPSFVSSSHFASPSSERTHSDSGARRQSRVQ